MSGEWPLVEAAECESDVVPAEPKRVRKHSADGLLARLTKEGEITAIYSLGAGTEGLLAALAAQPARDRPRPLYCIAHELTPLTRQALQEGRIDLVIDQRPDIEVQRAVTLLRALADGQPLPPFPVHTPTIYLRDNLPPAGGAH